MERHRAYTATREEVVAKLRHLGDFEVLAFDTDEESVMAEAAQAALTNDAARH